MATFSINETIRPHLFTYGESLCDTLPTLSSQFDGIEQNFNPAKLKEKIELLPETAFKLFDSSLLSICGWHFSSLKDLSQSRTKIWSQVLEDEILSDDDDPFEQTGYIMDLWNDADPIDIKAADGIFKTLFGKTITSLLNEIQDDILAKASANK